MGMDNMNKWWLTTGTEFMAKKTTQMCERKQREQKNSNNKKNYETQQQKKTVRRRWIKVIAAPAPPATVALAMPKNYLKDIQMINQNGAPDPSKQTHTHTETDALAHTHPTHSYRHSFFSATQLPGAHHR